MLGKDNCMRFVKDEVNTTPIEDTVFAVVKKAKAAIAELGEDKVINATIGSLYDEDEKLVAFETVFHHYDEITKETKAAYAASFTGNDDFREQVYNWVCQNHKLNLKHRVIATPGGTGAVSLCFNELLDEGQTAIIPEIAWGSYALMAEMHNLKIARYSLFKDNHFDMESFQKTCLKVLDEQNKLMVVINDPCHNPTGYSLSIQEWETIIKFLNECGEKAPVVLLNDIAYIDYAYDCQHSRDYLKTLESMSEHVMCVIAFSCSKTLTSYGLRCGAALALSASEEAVRSVEIVFEKTARALWSNIPNAAMDNFTYVTSVDKDAYLAEKAKYVALLKQRSEVFLKEAEEVNLPVYPYKEGFFITVAVPDNSLRDLYHEALMKEQIYTVKVNHGIRVAVCSLSVKHCYGLAERMKDIWDQIKGA